METAGTAVMCHSHFYTVLARQTMAILRERQKDSIVCKMEADRSVNGLPLLLILI